MTKRFDKLDTDGSGGISMEELMKLPELKGNPLAKRVYTVMGKCVNNTLAWSCRTLGKKESLAFLVIVTNM